MPGSWNLSERKLISTDMGHFVNSTETPLSFFHFSGYVPGSGQITGRNKFDSSYSFEANPELKSLFTDYSQRLVNRDYKRIKNIRPLLSFADSRGQKSKVRQGLMRFLKIFKP